MSVVITMNMSALAGVADTAPMPDELADTAEQQALLTAYLKRLTPADRRLLHTAAGGSVPRLCLQYGWPVSTAYDRRTRLLADARRLLGAAA